MAWVKTNQGDWMNLDHVAELAPIEQRRPDEPVRYRARAANGTVRGEFVMFPERWEKMLAPVVPATAEINAYALVFNATDVEISIFPVIGWRCGDGSLPDLMPVLPGDVEFNSETYDAWALKMPDGRFPRP
jgi:hypothetical protein